MAEDLGSGRPRLRQRLARLFLRQTPRPESEDSRTYSWARPVKREAELPPQYRSFFESLPAGLHDPLPYSVLTPTFRGAYGRAEPERLLCIVEGSVHVLECKEGRLQCTVYAPQCLHMLEYGLLLLHSWITIHAEDGSGTLRSTSIRFNSVSDYLMMPFMDCLRGPTAEGSDADLEMERARLDYLADSHYKFRAYGRASLRAGALVRQSIVQAEIRRELFRFLGISFSRLISPAHLSILSGAELITITDDAGQRWSKRPPHGAIWTYIPLSRIHGAELIARSDGTEELCVRVQGGLYLRSIFDPRQRLQLERMIGEFSS